MFVLVVLYISLFLIKNVVCYLKKKRKKDDIVIIKRKKT